MLMCAAGHDILYNWSVGGWAPHQDKLRIRIKKHANYQFFQYSLKIWERKNFGKLSRSVMYRIVYAGIEHSDASPINFRYDDMMIWWYDDMMIWWYWKSNVKPINWSPMFEYSYRGIKKKDYPPNSINRGFKAFVSKTKQSRKYTCPTK